MTQIPDQIRRLPALRGEARRIGSNIARHYIALFPWLELKEDALLRAVLTYFQCSGEHRKWRMTDGVFRDYMPYYALNAIETYIGTSPVPLGNVPRRRGTRGEPRKCYTLDDINGKDPSGVLVNRLARSLAHERP